jgi:hypothetical protein
MGTGVEAVKRFRYRLKNSVIALSYYKLKESKFILFHTEVQAILRNLHDTSDASFFKIIFNYSERSS